MKKTPLVLIILIAFLNVHAQSLIPVVVSSQGGFYTSPVISVSWTIGEVMSETFSQSNHFLTQGFHQPHSNLIKVKEDKKYDFFDAFSPNGDDKNDTWIIPILDIYPANSTTIFNRWGNDVWKTNNYHNQNNVFKGQNLNGEDLPDGTYFYIIKYGNNEKRGWLFIKR